MQLASWSRALFVVFVWGITFVNTRALLNDFSALEIQVLRFALAWCVLYAAYCFSPRKGKEHSPRMTPRDEGLFALMGLTGAFIYQLLENCAIYYTNASNVAILVSFGPIVTAILSRIFMGDKSLSLRLVLGSLVAIVGVALVSFNGTFAFDFNPLGDCMALCAMVSWGFYSVLVAKANKKGFPQVVVIRKSFFWALVMMLPLVVWGLTPSGAAVMEGSFRVTLEKGVNLTRFGRATNLLNFVFLGGLASATCFVLWNRACKALGVVKTTIGLYLMPIVGVVFATLFLGERLTFMSILGGLLIVSGVILTHHPKHP